MASISNVALCATCNHEYKYHIQPNGSPMPCDCEREEKQFSNGIEADVMTLCGCEEFVEATPGPATQN